MSEVKNKVKIKPVESIELIELKMSPFFALTCQRLVIPQKAFKVVCGSIICRFSHFDGISVLFWWLRITKAIFFLTRPRIVLYKTVDLKDFKNSQKDSTEAKNNPVPIFEGIQSKRKKRLFLGLSMGALGLCLIFTASRDSWVSLFLVFLGTLLLFYRKGPGIFFKGRFTQRHHKKIILFILIFLLISIF